MSATSTSEALASGTRLPRMRRRRRLRAGSVVAVLALAMGALGCVLPFLWMVSTSLRPISQSYTLPPRWLPTAFDYKNYTALLHQGTPILRFAWNSFKIAALVSLGQIFTCSTAGYAFAHIPFRGSKFLFGLILAALMIPIQVTILPIFVLMKNLGLVNNDWSIVLMSLTSAFGILLFRQAFLGLPKELLDSGRIDGAGEWKIFWRIALPLVQPTTAALATITFVSMWNQYFLPLILINSTDQMTLPLGVLSLRLPFGDSGSSIFMAAVTASVLPCLLIFLLAQRWLVQTMARSGIRG